MTQKHVNKFWDTLIPCNLLKKIAGTKSREFSEFLGVNKFKSCADLLAAVIGNRTTAL